MLCGTPRLDDDRGLGAGAEPFEAEALIAELAVKALRRAALIDPGKPCQNGLVPQVRSSSARETNSGPLSERR